MGIGARGADPRFGSLCFGHLEKMQKSNFFHYDQRGREFEYQLLRGALEFAKSLCCKSIITTPKLLGIGDVNIFDEFGFKKLEKSKVSPVKSHEMHTQLILNLES